MAEKENYFNKLLKVDLSGFSSEKQGLLYIQWSRAWSAFKSAYPMSYLTVYETEDERPYFDDGKTCWVKVGATVVFENGEKLEHIEYLAIMDHRNQSIKKDAVTSTNVVNSIQRCATKAIARHGVGLSVYYGEAISAELNEVHEEAAKELKAARKEINDLGKRLIAQKLSTKDNLYGIIMKYNNGDNHTSTIPDLEVCQKIMDELNALMPEDKGEE